MSGEYLWDRSGKPDPDVERLEALLRPLGQSDPPPRLMRQTRDELPPRNPPVSFFVALGLAAALVIVLTGVVWRTRNIGTGFEVTRVAGTPTVGSQAVTDRGELTVGRWLETDAASRASMAVGDIGQVEIDPDTRLSLVSSRPGDYRLRLHRGTMHALIWAPPGQFFVETAASTAIDLGCAYTMSMDESGRGLVRVKLGWVGLEWNGRESFIPEGAVCLTRPRLGPGTPYYEDATDDFRSALETFDATAGTLAAGATALDRVLAAARPRDALTVWHLLARVDAADRDRVFDRLAAFVPPPATVTREGIRAGRQDMLDAWWDGLHLGTASWWRLWKRPWRDAAPLTSGSSDEQKR